MKKLRLLIILLSLSTFVGCNSAQKNQPEQQEQKQGQPAISDEVKQYLKEQGIDVSKPVGPMLSTNVQEAEINVDCAETLSDFLHVERYNNFESSMEFVDQRDADIKFFNESGLHGKIYRVWFIGNSYYDEITDKVDISEMSDYLSDASKISDYVLVNCSHLGVVRGWDVSDDIKVERLSKILKELKKNFPKIKYIEATNEPDYANEGVTPDNYYDYYKIYYQAVNKVNDELNPEIPLLVGGPSVSQFSMKWLQPFLDAYVKDPSPEKRLDFISYHGYYTKPDSAYILFKDDPSLVKEQRTLLNRELASRGIRIDIPVFITEMGIYPGPAFDDFVTMKNDHLRQAVGMASLFYWYLTTADKTYPFNWVMRHRKEGRKDQLVTRNEFGQPMIETQKLTPYGNMMVMMSKMKDTRISSTSSTEIEEGKGLYSLATKDESGISVMVWNFQSRDTQGFDATLNLNNLHKALNTKNVNVKLYKIDGEHSNYHTDLENCNLQMVEEKTIKTDDVFKSTLHFEPNTLQLIVLEPAETN
ncbi:GH39 family glycosyl hydrolase [Maribellus mangrovi]|uniref:GH39 family glycosyl hydrolase n=1 Tax=Maribellus mangrovi TaxID=3133146 RepID=UPI0030ECC2F0